MTEHEIGDFLSKLITLCAKYKVNITSLCDSDTGRPHACFCERGADTYYNIDNMSNDLEYGATLNFD